MPSRFQGRSNWPKGDPDHLVFQGGIANLEGMTEAKIILAGVDGLSLNDASVTAAEELIAPWIASQPHAAGLSASVPEFASVALIGLADTIQHAA